MSSRKRSNCSARLMEDVPFEYQYEQEPKPEPKPEPKQMLQWKDVLFHCIGVLMGFSLILMITLLIICEYKLGNGNPECKKLTYYIDENKLNIINTQMMWSFVYYLGISISTLVLMEFVCLQFNLTHSPSTLISKISDKSKELFEYLGKIVALISSFYARLKLELLWQAISNLFVATAKLLISPFYFLEGYKDIMLQYKYPIMVIVGTATIIGAVSYGVYYYM